MSMTSILDRLRSFAKWSKTLDVPEGRLQGTASEVFQADEVVIFMVDSNGAVRQLLGCTITGGDAQLIHKGRSQVLHVLDHFGVEDHVLPVQGNDL